MLNTNSYTLGQLIKILHFINGTKWPYLKMLMLHILPYYFNLNIGILEN